MQRTRRHRAPRRRRRATRRRHGGGALFAIKARPSVIDFNLGAIKNDNGGIVTPAGKRKGLVYSVHRFDRGPGEKPDCKTKQMVRVIDYVEDTLALISKGPTKTFKPEQKYTEMFEVKAV